MDKSLLPLTRLVLAVSAIVQLLVGLLGTVGLFIAPWLATSFLIPVTNPGVPILGIQLDGAMFLANGLGAAFALHQNRWAEARTYLVIAGCYVALALLLTSYGQIATRELAPIVWLYMAAALVYLPLLLFVWRQQSSSVKRP